MRRRPTCPHVEPVVLDLTDLDAAEAGAAGTDILVNNAGLQLVRPLEEFPPEAFHTVLTVMLEAPFRLISPYKGAYVAAKHGLEGLSKTAALEGAPHGVTSNCLAHPRGDR